jgi:hypothetical protein
MLTPKPLTRLAVCAAAVAWAALLLAPAAYASGGASIAEAPTLPVGTLVSGGGQPWHQYYRLPLYGGDEVTLDLEMPGAGDCPAALVLSLYQPQVTDYQIEAAQPVDSTGWVEQGKHEFKWVSPFTGAGIVQATGCTNGVAAFNLTAAVAHQTAVALHAPTLAKRGSAVTVSATVQSAAGVPQGTCLIRGTPTPLTNGQCSGRVRLGHGRRQTIHVEFVPEDGWQASSGHRTIRLYR